jgi:hypothetical protein
MVRMFRRKLEIFGFAALLAALCWLLTVSDALAADDKKAPVIQDNPIFLEVPGMTIPVIRGGRVEKYILIKVTLEMTDDNAKSLAEKSFPRLKDSFYRSLHDYFGFQRRGTMGINVRVVKARLKRAGARAIGKGQIKEVLIQRAFERASGK